MAYRILGYADRLSVRPGDRIAFKVSSTMPQGRYHASLQRLICGDDSPQGPGFKSEAIASAIDGEYRPRRQEIAYGSSALIGGKERLLAASFTLQAMIWPTLPGNGRAQAILGDYDAATASGHALYVDEGGRLAFRAGGNAPLVLTEPLLAHHWHEVFAAFDAASGRATLGQTRLIGYAGRPSTLRESAVNPLPPGAGGAFRIAAWNAGKAAAAHFNGKIDSPRVSDRALTPEEVTAQRARPGPYAVAAWDFSKRMESDRILDISGRRRHGRLINLPTRAMTGWNWDGSVFDWRQQPVQYGAIHFHDDDLYDCGWKTDFALEVPAGLKSGIYGAHVVQADETGAPEEDFIPFFVRAAPGREQKLAVLIPTASYLAYANHQMASSWWFDELSLGRFTTFSPLDRFLEENEGFGLSVYDIHNDGSGVCHSSHLRPILNMRPRTELWQFTADTQIVDWLEAMAISYDVVTDHDLHREGPACLRPYRCVVTGSHPEYHSLEMLTAIRAYTGSGGRLVYLGANGFYWRIAFHKTLPGVIEHRRAEDGMRGWIAEGGEYHMSFTGELGGLWRRLGWPPQALCGVGFTAQGFIRSVPYERLPASFDPRVAFMFDGIGPEERIGDFGQLGDGAAGWEVDRADIRLGTPPHALIVAAARDFPDHYHWVKEEMTHSHSAVNGDTCPLVRCDMVFYETPDGGAVFSTGSIAWAAALAHNGYANNVSRLTGNVVRRFLDPQPF